jgi:peptidoglycan-associated lipoprotein
MRMLTIVRVITRVMTVALILAVVAGCARRQTTGRAAPAPPELPPPVARGGADLPPPSTTPPPTAPSRPAERVIDTRPVAPLGEDGIGARTLDDLNRDSPFGPAFFSLDSAELDAAGRAVVSANADIMKRNQTWAVTIEGHCDERGTAEYNLALGERRARAVKTYLVSLGITQDRVRAISYGKEFPFDPGHDESAWAQNRRAHFVITAK